MKIFCDTNILLEFIQQRKLVQQVEQVLSFAEKWNGGTGTCFTEKLS